MSQDNVEAVRRGLDAFNADDTDAFVSMWDRECEFFNLLGSQMDGAPYQGHAGLRRYREEAAQTWSELRLEAERVVEADDDAVVVVRTLRGQGRGSGIVVEQRIGMVYEFREGKVRTCRAYPDPQGALEAAGLSE